jgi:UDP-N-acetylmuramyl tripeptide synthase
MSHATINGQKVYPQSIIDFVKTPSGLKKVIDYLQSQKVEHKHVKGNKR